MDIVRYIQRQQREIMSHNKQHWREVNKISPDMRPVVPQITVGGVKFSVQASASHYCSPRLSDVDWHEVEMGFPSIEPPDYIKEYAEHPDWCGTVYAFVPVALIERWIAELEAKTQDEPPADVPTSYQLPEGDEAAVTDGNG